MRCIKTPLLSFRFWQVLVISVLLVACANKDLKQQDTLSEVDHKEKAFEHAFQEQYRQVVELMKSLESEIASDSNADIFKENSELLEANERLEEIHKQKPYYPGPILNLGIIAWWLGEVDQAKSYFNMLLVLESGLAEASAGKAISDGEKEKAAGNLGRFTSSAFNHLGLIYREQGDFEQSEKYYRQALEQNAEDKIAIRNLAILLDLYQGRLAEALPLYEQYQSLLDEPDAQVKDWIFDLKNRL